MLSQNKCYAKYKFQIWQSAEVLLIIRYLMPYYFSYQEKYRNKWEMTKAIPELSKGRVYGNEA